MNKEIKELEYRRDLIENLEIKAVDEKTWHEICLTPARHDNLLLEIAKETFPKGENFKRNTNDITFQLNGFNVTLPTCAINGIKIDLKWFDKSYRNLPKVRIRHENMKRYFELLDSGNYKWNDLACCRCNSEIVKESKLKLFIWWFSKAKWRKVDRKKWEDMFKHDDEQNIERLEKHQEKVKDIEMKLSKINETINILKEFAEVRGCVKEDGVWSTVNIENYFI